MASIRAMAEVVSVDFGLGGSDILDFGPQDSGYVTPNSDAQPSVKRRRLGQAHAQAVNDLQAKRLSETSVALADVTISMVGATS